MNVFSLGFAVVALVVCVALAWDSRRNRIRAERSAAESAALLAERAEAARQVEAAEAVADAQLLRALAMRCYPTGDCDDVVELGPIHDMPAADGERHWFIHVKVPDDVSDQLARADIWKPDSRPVSALLNFLLPTTLSGSAAAASEASAGEGDH